MNGIARWSSLVTHLRNLACNCPLRRIPFARWIYKKTRSAQLPAHASPCAARRPWRSTCRRWSDSRACRRTGVGGEEHVAATAGEDTHRPRRTAPGPPFPPGMCERRADGRAVMGARRDEGVSRQRHAGAEEALVRGRTLRHGNHALHNADESIAYTEKRGATYIL